MLTLKKLISHIKRCNKKKVRYNFLGLVENNDLTDDVRRLFTFTMPNGSIAGYDWVNGNTALKDLIKSIE